MHNSTLTWRKGWFLSATFLLVVFITVSCKKKEHQLGEGVVDDSEILTSGVIDTFSLQTSTFTVTDIKANDRIFGMLGSYEDPIFGGVNNEIYTQLRLPNTSPSFGNLNDIVVDSVVLSMVYAGKYGNNGDQTIEVYEIGGTERLYIDSTYYTYTTFPETGSNLVVPGNEVQYLDPLTVSYIDTNIVEPQLRIRLDTNFAWQLFNESANNPASFESNDNFVEFFKGIKIKTVNGSQQPGEGGIFYFNMTDTDTKVTIFYKSAGEVRTYDLVINSSAPYINHTDISQSAQVQSVINNPALGQKEFYTQSPRTRALLKIPGLSSIPSNSVIHSASLELPVQYQTNQPFEPGLNLRVALFTSSTDSSLISDLSTVGLFDVSGKKFTVDITNYVQRIVSGEFENTGFVLSPTLFSNSADRIVFNGPETVNKEKPSFKIIYTEF